MYNIQETIDNRYEVKNILMGGMGIVYVCVDLETQKFIALKTIQDGLAKSMSGMERFVREASTWISLGKNPHIVYADKIQPIEGRPYIFMEYIPPNGKYGSSLRGQILQHKVDIAFATTIMIQLCDGLTFAQTRIPGIVHRDLKPENILMTPNKVAKVSDFGLVTGLIDDLEELLPIEESLDFFQTNITRSGKIVGTPPYMSPEQCLGLQLDIRSDIYALGCIFFELLTHQWMFSSNNAKEWINWHINNRTPISPSSINFQVSKKIDEIVWRCLQKKPAERYENFEEMKMELVSAFKELTGCDYIKNESFDVSTQRPEIDNVRSYIAVKDYKSALNLAEKILQTDPANVDALINKSVCLMALNKDNDALEILERAKSLDPTSQRALINIGTIKIRVGEIDKAVEYLSNAIKSDPSSWEAWNNLGIAYEEQGDNKKAIECYESSIKITPWQSEAWQNKARLLVRLRNREQGMLCYKNAFNYAVSYQTRLNIALELLSEPDFQTDEFIRLAIKSSDKSFSLDLPNTLKDQRQMFGLPEVDSLIRSIVSDKNLNASYLIAFRKVTTLSGAAYACKKIGKSDWSSILDMSYLAIDEWKKNNLAIFTPDRFGKALAFLYFISSADFLINHDYNTAYSILANALAADPHNALYRIGGGICLFHLEQWSKSLEYLSDLPNSVLELMGLSQQEVAEMITTIHSRMRR